MPNRQKKQRRQKSRPTRRSKPAPQQAIVRAAPPTVSEVIEQVLIQGNLIALTVPQRLEYYNAVCKSLGLNPLTRPFEYISFEGKLQLYARKDCTEQLRKIHGIAVVESASEVEEGMLVVHVKVQDRHGRTDTGTGAVDLSNLKGKDKANAIMKCETKAKRRATLSMAGLGFLDESELDTVGDYGTLTSGGRIMTVAQPVLPEPENPHLKAYLDKLTPEQRAAEEAAMAKKTPAQREIVERRIVESKSSQDTQPAEREGAGAAGRHTAPQPEKLIFERALTYLWIESDQEALIDGNAGIKRELQQLLGKYVKPPKFEIRLNGDELEALKYELKSRGVTFTRRYPKV